MIVDWKAAHPLLRFVQLDDVQIADTLGVKTPDWAMSIVESTSTPLILAGEKDGQRMVWAGFDMLQSTWPLRVSFPIFIANAVEWLNPTTSQASMVNVRTGEALVATLEETASALSMLLPDGQVTELAASPDSRQVIFADTLQQGIYRLQNGTNEVVFMAFCVLMFEWWYYHKRTA
jgi:hypothetical protein